MAKYKLILAHVLKGTIQEFATMEPEYIKKRRLPKKRHKKIKRSRYIR